MTNISQSPAADADDALRAFMNQYQEDFHKLYADVSYAWWDAATTGTEEAFAKSSEASLALSTYHASKEKFETLKSLLAEAQDLSPIEKRAAEEALRAFEQSQFSPEIMEKMTKLSSEIEQAFQTQRGKLDGKEFTNNELLEMLEKETDSKRRYEIWDALKQVGGLVDQRMIELVKIRNEAAQKLGYKNYWEMSVSFQDFDPAELTAIFDELEKETTPIFAKVKAELDDELKAKFGVSEIMPWHYDNPFFQQAPPSAEIDKNIFYEGKTAEDIRDIATRYYEKLGFKTDSILANSDLFEKEGKSQHAFSNNMNLDGDVRILCNLKPTAEWMSTQLHELGHALYDLHVDPTLPYNLRTACHIFTTEGIAMLFETVANDPNWLTAYVGVDSETAQNAAQALKKQRLREQLIFCRWTLVMFHFERALYENPDQDLNTLWWDTVEKYQMMPRPKDRHLPDWASKPHFVIAPVYYHNYMLGELFGAQLRKSLPFNNQTFETKELGDKMIEKVFEPGMKYHWKEFVKRATGEELSPKAFADELKASEK